MQQGLCQGERYGTAIYCAVHNTDAGFQNVLEVTYMVGDYCTGDYLFILQGASKQGRW
jgi:hypothetical protein